MHVSKHSIWRGILKKNWELNTPPKCTITQESQGLKLHTNAFFAFTALFGCSRIRINLRVLGGFGGGDSN
jgi:hypothetical protein